MITVTSMALLQALLVFLSRSSGKILNAVFGWAVTALFGRVRAKDRTRLTIVIGLAAVWPLLALGIVFPRVATLVLAFVPIPESVPSWTISLGWAALALVVPVIVGSSIASRARAGSELVDESGFKRVLRGFPVTLALAFLLMFVTVPFVRISTILRRWTESHVTLVSEGRAYHEVAALLLHSYGEHGLEVELAKPPWYMKAPTAILLKIGGKAFKGFVPEQLHYLSGKNLRVALYPNDLMLRGSAENVAWAQGLAAEATAHSRAYQTGDPRAQEIEREIRRVWDAFETHPRAHERSAVLRSRLNAIATEISECHIKYEEWQVLYRKALQLSRAIEGRRPLLSKNVEVEMEEVEEVRMPRPGVPVPLELLSVRALVGDITTKVTQLAKKEIELAKTELKADLKQEVAMAAGLGIAGVCALITVNLLCVAAVLGLATVMPGWGAAFVVAGIVLAIGTIAGFVGWAKRVKEPLQATRRSIKEDVQWTREKIA